ncbi:hypothetical protein K502DRAFT_353788 [Neoconidiobolus thromboides FSU 785]|nr:hypothetical protein K502DRAFT_353788 [Neoconidiobolus thromboides FSU 785]
MYDQLKKLYRIASIGPEDQNSVLDSNGKILSHKLGEEHSRILQLIDNNKEALHQSLLEKLNKIWVDCSVSKENIDKGMKEIEDRGVSLETLELMINDCDYQKFQLENAPDIYDKIRKRKLIIDRLREFEANLNKKSKDRFKGSSLNFAAEEKFRKENYPKLGRLEDSLIEPIKLYERKYHKHFLFEGGHFLTILQSSIQRRNGNVEIIGVNDAACEVSFASRPSLPRLQPTTVKSTKDTLKPAEPQNGKSSRLSTKSRLSNSNNLRADSQAAARSGKTTPSLRSPVPQNGKSSRLSTNSKLSNVNRLRIDPQTTERSRRSTPLQKSPESENKKGTSHSFDKLSQANNVQVDSQGLKKFGKSNTLLKSPEFEPVVSPPKSASSSRKSSILSHSKLDIVYEELDSVDSDSCPASSLMLKSSSETLTIDTVITPTNVNVSSVQNSFKNNSQGQLNDMKPLPTKAKVQPKLPTQLPAKSNLSSKSVPNVKQEQIKIGPIAKTTSPRTVTKTPTSIAKAPSRTGGRASTPLKKASSLQPKTQTTQTTPIISKPTLKVRPSKLTIEAKETGLDARPQIKPTPPIKPSSNLKGSKGNITPSLVPQAQPKLVS